MGFFGGDNDNSRTSDIAEEQFRQNQAQLEQKRQNLYKTRLDIIKGQGGQNWTADRSPRLPVEKHPGGKFKGIKEGINEYYKKQIPKG